MTILNMLFYSASGKPLLSCPVDQQGT